jgi:hypothetical protein
MNWIRRIILEIQFRRQRRKRLRELKQSDPYIYE